MTYLSKKVGINFEVSPSFKKETPFLVFIISTVIIWLAINITNIRLASAIDLGLFTFFLALLVTVVFTFLLEGNSILLKIRLSNVLYSKRIRESVSVLITPNVILAAGVIALFIAYIMVNPSLYNEIVYLEGYNLSPFQLLVSAAIFIELLFAPAYIIHRTLLRRFNLNILERITFYPIISALVLGTLGLIIAYFKIAFQEKLFVLVLSTMLIVLLLWNHKSPTSHQFTHQWDVNLLEALGIVAAVTFNLFMFYSAIGGGAPFLRSDMWHTAYCVAMLTKFGLSGYLSQGLTYPIFYTCTVYAWSEVLPLPYVNDLLFTAFFNHVFSIIALYTLAKIMFKDSRSALLSVAMWTVFSGFTWLFVMLYPPLWSLFGNELLLYISLIGGRIGLYSGAVLSPIYADGETLTRLWSLCLLLASTAALLKGHFSGNQKVGLLLFGAGFIQILLCHIIETPILALALLALILVGNKNSKDFIIPAFLILSVLSAIGVIFTTIISGFNIYTTLISLSPVLAIILGIILNQIKILVKKRSPEAFTKIEKKLRATLPLGLIYIYGLMLITFAVKNNFLSGPIITVWYYPAVEWGVMGLVTVSALSYLTFKCKKWNFGLKFAVTVFAMELAFLFFLNYINYSFLYVIFPYLFEPFLFLPFLALISSQAILKLFYSQDCLVKLKISQKNKQYISIVLLILLFSFGSLDAVLSASYWKTNNGAPPWPHPTLNPWYPDYQLMNFLYLSPSNTPYEYIATFVNSLYPESYVALPAGVSVLTQPMIDILTHTNDSREIYLLTLVNFIKYILVSKDNPPSNESYLANAIKSISPVFSNIRYEVYLVSQLNLSATNLLPSSRDFLTAEKIVFNGALSLVDSLNGLICMDNIKGEIHPVENGEVLIIVESQNGENTNITAQTPFISITGKLTMIKMKATPKYFEEIGSSAEQLTIYGTSTFVIFNTFEDRAYMEYLAYKGIYGRFPIPSDFLLNHASVNNIKKLQIEYYLSVNNANPIEALTNPIGIVWTALTAAISILMWIELYRKKKQVTSTED